MVAVCRGEQAICADGAATVVRQRPGDALGQVRGAARRVNAGGGELHGAVGGVQLVVGLHGSVVEHTVLIGGGDQQQCAGNRALHAVRGAVAHFQGAGALALGGDGGGAAAVQIDGVHDALLLEVAGLVIDGHAHGIGVLAAVGHEGHDSAVLLDADGVSGHQIRVTGIHCHLAVADQEEGAGNGLLHVGAVRPELADGVAAVLQNSEIRLLGAAVVLLNDVALHDEVAERLTGLHVVIVAVGGRQHVAAGGPLIILRLVRGGLQAPGEIAGAVFPAVQCAAGGIVALIGGLEGHLCVRAYRQHIAGDLGIAAGLVQEHVRFGHALGQRIIRLLDQDLAVRRRDFFGCQRGGGQERQKETA